MENIFLRFVCLKPSLKSLELFTDVLKKDFLKILNKNLQAIDADSRKAYILANFNIKCKINVLIMTITQFSRNKYLPMREAIT